MNSKFTYAYQRTLIGGDSDFAVFCDPITNGDSVKAPDDFEASLLLNFAEGARLEVQHLNEHCVREASLFHHHQNQTAAQIEFDSLKRQRKLASLRKECNANQRKLNRAYRKYQEAEEEKLNLLNQEVRHHQGVTDDFEYQKQLCQYYTLKLKEMKDQKGHQEKVFEAWQYELFGWWRQNVVTINTEDYGLGSPMMMDDDAFKLIDYPMLLE